MSSFGYDLRRALDKNQPPDFPAAFFASALLVAIQMGWALATDGDNLATLRAAVAQRRPLFFWDTGYDRSFISILMIGAFGFMIVATLFSNQKAVRPRYAWLVFLLWGVLMSAVNVWSANAAFGGYADPDGVTWINRRGTVDHQPWSKATRIVAGCEYSKKRGSRLRYEVQFGKRVAELGPYGRGPHLSQWLKDVARVEQAMPGDTSFARSAFNIRCVGSYARDLYLEDDKALVAVFRPTPVHVREINREYPVWGAFVAEVIAEREAAARK